MTAESIARALGGAKRTGNGWMARCPAHPDKMPSLHLTENDEKLLWHCHGGCSQQQVGDALRARALLNNAAAHRGAAPRGGAGRHDQPTVRQNWTPITPIPNNVPETPAHPHLGEPTHRWAYLDGEGRVIGFVNRFDTAAGKEFRPLTYCRGPQGQQQWQWMALPEPRPLYRLDKIAARPHAPVLVCEGEKAADACTNLLPDYATTTSPGGCKAPQKADWSPLRGRRVVIWPDADDGGAKYGHVAADMCRKAGAKSIKILTPPQGAPRGWDAADALAEGWTPEKALALVEAPSDAEKSAPATRLQVYTLADFLTLKIPPREMILAPFLPTQGLVMLFAKYGIGKTHLSLGIAYAVASGGNFLKWSAPEPRPTLFVDGEMPATAIQERLAGIVAANDKELPAPDYLRIITPDRQDEHGVSDLATPGGQAEVEAVLGDAQLLILDNISCLCRSTKENEGDSWEPIQAWLLNLRRRGVSVLFIHHAGKSGDQRGTSRRADVLDSVISLKRPGDYHASEGARFEVHYGKSRGFMGDDARPFEARLETRDGAACWTVKDLEQGPMERVVELINSGMAQKDIAEHLGIDKSNVSRHAGKARELGLITSGAGKN